MIDVRADTIVTQTALIQAWKDAKDAFKALREEGSVPAAEEALA